MERPKEIDEYQANYMPGTWATYTPEEYYWWVRLYSQRALHRANREKMSEDLIDARNYLLMWIAVNKEKEED